MSAGLFAGFAHQRRHANGIDIHVRHGGDGPPLLLLHGFPQTHVIWHKVAPQLAERGVVNKLFTPIEDWQSRSRHAVSGRTTPTGHYIPEEAPDLLSAQMQAFFAD